MDPRQLINQSSCTPTNTRVLIISNGRMSTNFVLRSDCGSSPPCLMGEGVLVSVYGEGERSKGEFQLTVIREQAVVGPAYFVLVNM